MPAPSSDPFFRTLPLFTAFEGVAEAENYRALPQDWWLATADIVDSTGAIAEGRYKSVNMAGASVISAVLNAVGDYEIPFVFSGDGAMLALPPSGLAAARAALAAVQTHVEATLALICARPSFPLPMCGRQGSMCASPGSAPAARSPTPCSPAAAAPGRRPR